MTFNEEYNNFLNIFEKECIKYFDSINGKIPENLFQSMHYSVFNGGKRIRPVLMLAFAKFFDIPLDCIINYALCLEFIHCYSLVHDDLPCMDNDDYRRGKLSTHKKFGYGNGVLAGDALLNLSMEIALRGKKTINDFEALKIIYDYSGCFGMIGGQSEDINFDGNDLSKDKLFYIYSNKTSKLLSIAMLIPSVLASKQYYEELKELGEKFGVLFQIQDDLLDVESSLEKIGKTPHKDEQENKLTSIKLFGIDGAKELRDSLYNDCFNILTKIGVNQFIKDLFLLILKRDK